MNDQPKSALYFSRIEARQLAQELGTDLEKGLASEEANLRLKKFGPNQLAVHKQRNEWIELLSHFTSPLVLILLIATGISLFMGETINAFIILAMVMLSVVIDFFQERDANKAAERLKRQVKNRVTVLRDGIEKELMHEELCQGDLLLLNAGKVVPADARVVFARDFFLNQSSLTGESFPCEKIAAALLEANEELTSMDNLVFMGSSVSTGTAKAIVIHTGSNTQLGKLAAGLVSREPETEFAKGLKDFGYLILKATLVLVLFIFLVNAVLGRHLLDSFMFSLAVAVGLTPELLPMVMSVTMSIGSGKMAKKGVIVKKLAAIPNFGSMEVLCTDKTGTLTEDRIQLIKCVDEQGVESDEVFEWVYLNSYYQTGVKNPLDDAVLKHKTMDVSTTPKVDEIPFDFFRKRMSVVVKHKEQLHLICKGAPEEIFQVCTMEEERKKKAIVLYEQLSAEGFRVLALASKPMESAGSYSKKDECLLELKGFVAFLDPPKQDADDVIRALASIGVEVKIITGDNHLVTQKICKEIGLEIKGIMQGHEMEHLTDDALRLRVQSTTIFTRFSPDQKNRIILALKGNHHAVGYMGDGINDAPSLRTADIGISVSNATDVAKDAADIILTQKDLLVLKEGILEGRKTFGNTMKYILMGLSSNFGNMFSVAAAVLFLPFLPMLPVQILINNFLYDTSQVTIPSDHVDASYTARPQRWDMKLIKHYMVLFGLTSSIFDLATFYLLYKIFPLGEAAFRTGWFLESLSTQVLVVFIIRTSHWPFFQSLPSAKLVWSTLFCLALGWTLPWMPFASQLGFVPLPLPLIGWLVLIVLAYLVAAEIVKRYIYNMKQPLNLMKHSLVVFFLFFCLLVQGQDKWKSNGIKEGIELYTKVDPNASFKTIKTVFTIDAPLSKIAFVVMDVNRTNEWVYAAKNCKILKQYSPTDLIYYSEVVVPPPFNNRDFAIRITMTQDKITRNITVIADSKPDFLPEKPGLVRIHQSIGKWQITPMANGLTKVEYILQVDPGGAIPAWLVNLFATKGPFESFKGLREQVKKKDYDGKKLSGIRD